MQQGGRAKDALRAEIAKMTHELKGLLADF